MYTGSYIPTFPYQGDQVAISSGRLLFHAKDDSLFLFANKAISLATSGSTHINSSEGVYINGSSIELGLNAQEKVIKGDTAVTEFRRLYGVLISLSNALKNLSSSELETAIPELVKAAEVASATLTDLDQNLPTILSSTTKTL